MKYLIYTNDREVEINIKDFLDEAFEHSPGLVIDWIRENSDAILKYKKCVTDHLNNFIDILNQVDVK